MAHILVIDDEPAMLQLIRRVLEKDQHIVTLQENAKEVLTKDFRQYDLILLDIMMPDMDGLEICSKIRSNVDCPIIFLTAKTQETDILQSLLERTNFVHVSMPIYGAIQGRKNILYVFPVLFFSLKQRKSL